MSELTDMMRETASENVRLKKEILSLKSKLEREHENFLSVHRENMALAARNVELVSKLDKCREALGRIRLRTSEATSTTPFLALGSIGVIVAEMLSDLDKP